MPRADRPAAEGDESGRRRGDGVIVERPGGQILCSAWAPRVVNFLETLARQPRDVEVDVDAGILAYASNEKR